MPFEPALEAVPIRFARVGSASAGPRAVSQQSREARLRETARTPMTELRYLSPRTLDEAISAFAAGGSGPTPQARGPQPFFPVSPRTARPRSRHAPNTKSPTTQLHRTPTQALLASRTPTPLR